MRPFLTPFPIILLLAVNLAAQTQPPTTPALSNYLSLTSAQTQSMAANNAEYNATALAKQNRLAEVQGEIVQETGRENLNVGALGERYVELEVICRELVEAGRRQRERNLALLNDSQKARLNTLEEALRLAAVARKAQQSLLLPAPRPMNPLIGAATSFDDAGTFGMFDFPATFPMCRTGAAAGTGLFPLAAEARREEDVFAEGPDAETRDGVLFWMKSHARRQVRP